MITIFKNKETIQKIIEFCLYAIIITMPVTFTFGVFSQDDAAHPIIGAQFTIADFLIGATFLLWLYKILVYNEYRDIILPPLPVLAFIGVGIFSFINAYSLKEWLKELIQILEYFFVFYLLFINNIRKRDQINRIFYILSVLTAIIVLVALYQHLILDGTPYLIRSLFENQNIYGCFLALVLPLIFGFTLYAKNRYLKIALFLILLISPITLFNGGALLALIISFGVISLLKSWKTFSVYVLVFISYLVLFPHLPEKNVNTIKSSLDIFEPHDVNYSYYRVQTILYSLRKYNLVDKWIGNKHLVISNSIFMSSQLPEIKPEKRYSEMNGEKHIKQQYLEWHAALNLMNEYPLFGAGLGNFQSHIGHYYGKLPKINTAEPNLHNGYLVIGGSLGFLGLTAFISMLVFGLSNCCHLFKMKNDTVEKGQILGILGGLLSFSLMNLFTSALIIGILGFFLVVLGIQNVLTKLRTN